MPTNCDGLRNVSTFFAPSGTVYANVSPAGASLEQCKKDRENLNKLVKGYTGEINAMEAALAEAAAREAQAAKRLAEYDQMLIDAVGMLFDFVLDDEEVPDQVKAMA